ncbi:MAG TPA: sulfatase-like hydrolase/transferase, partial [Candidatus Binatia bacterium]|nr:sulfatase-like hydrolase/transferase [Candidatus Binatia bacterium]
MIVGKTRLVVILALATSVGCHEPPAGNRIERLADTVYADRLIGDGGTSRFPYVELAGETHVSCSDPASRAMLSGMQFSHELTLRPGDVVELAFALEGAGFAGEVVFIAAVIGENGDRATFRTVLDGTEGRELGRWHEATIDTESIVGPARIELATASSVIAGSVGEPQSPARPHFVCPIIVNRRIPPERRPNVIVISLDTLRADRLGIYGYPRATSPNIDTIFGRDGVVVDHAYSQATNTLRGHAAMLTGLNPAISVAVGAGKHRSGKSTRGMPTLADHLRRHGYRTAAFTEGGYVSASYGFASGFDVFVETKNPDVGSGEIDKTFAKAEEWARSHAGEPLFLFLHTYEVHSPYKPPVPYRDRFPATLGASQIEVESALYDAEIAYTDARLATLLETLGA